jgi:hypothetical protein
LALMTTFVRWFQGYATASEMPDSIFPRRRLRGRHHSAAPYQLPPIGQSVLMFSPQRELIGEPD